VVEARRQDWKTDPFKLKEDDGYFTARGSSDDKAMAASFVSILSQLKREGFKPSRDIVLALTADEELGDVPTNGAFWLVNNQRALLDAEFGINEGGWRPAQQRQARAAPRAGGREDVHHPTSSKCVMSAATVPCPRPPTRSTNSARRWIDSARTASP